MAAKISKPKSQRVTSGDKALKAAAKTKPATKAKPAAKVSSVAKKKSAAKAAKPTKGQKGEKSAAASAANLAKKKPGSLGDWRAATLARMRDLILAADAEIIEERKWRKPSNGMVGIPVWSHGGIVCTGETYKQVVKLTFAKGASLADPARLFNASLEGGTRRAIDLREGEEVDAAAFQALVRAAVAHNIQPAAQAKAGANAMSDSKAKVGASKSKPTASKTSAAASKAKPTAKEAKPVKLLSGGNPQIAKGDGDAPVQAYLAALSGWKRELGERLDGLIVRCVPKVTKAVKWNSPFYGVEGQGWFVSFHVFTRYIKVTFFRGTSLRPVPSGGTSKDARWIDIHEDDFDEAQLTQWLKQAAKLPGWMA